MAITLKKQSRPEIVQGPESISEEDIHRLGLMHEASVDAKAKIKELSKIVDAYNSEIVKLQDKLDNYVSGDDGTLNIEGSEFILGIGAKGKSRSIKDISKVRTILGHDTFMALAKVNLTDLDKYLTEAQLKETVHTDRTARVVKFRRVVK